MKRLLFVLSIAALSLAPTGCEKAGSNEATATTEPAKAAATSAAPDATTAKAPEAKPAEKPADKAPAPAKPAPPRMFAIPEGTAINVFLTDPISTAKNKTGDAFTGSVADPFIVNGETIIERGATVKGKIVEAEGSGRIKGKANIRLTLTSIVQKEKAYPIETRAFAAEAESTKGRDAGIIAGGGGVGAAIGALAGGKKGAATGAIIGAAAGTGGVLATKGKEVELGPETKLTFALEKATELPKIR
jgi:hypothetical protein